MKNSCFTFERRGGITATERVEKEESVELQVPVTSQSSGSGGGASNAFLLQNPIHVLEAVHFVKVFTKIRGQNPGLGQTYVYLLSLCHIASAIQDSYSDLPPTVLSN